MIFRPQRLHSKLEPNKAVYTGLPEAFTIEKFIDSSVHGLVGHMTSDNTDQFKQPLCVVYYKVDYEKNPKGKFPNLRILISVKKQTSANKVVFKNVHLNGKLLDFILLHHHYYHPLGNP